MTGSRQVYDVFLREVHIVAILELIVDTKGRKVLLLEIERLQG